MGWLNMKHISNKTLMSVTRMIFITTQISALIWVFTSYAIAVYATVRLQRVYTMAELSEPAIHTILGVGFLKVLENIFEHNDGFIFGSTKDENSPVVTKPKTTRKKKTKKKEGDTNE